MTAFNRTSYTTSSRTPGRVNVGRAWILLSHLVLCEKCKRYRLDLGGPHSPHWELVDGEQVKVDCVGEVCP